MNNEETKTHTPGPWKVDNINYGKMHVVTNDNQFVAQIGYTDITPYSERISNARLIAAAPETAAERDRLRGELGEALQAIQLLSTERDYYKIGSETYQKIISKELEKTVEIVNERDSDYKSALSKAKDNEKKD